MNSFTYRAVDQHGHIVRGQLAAAGEMDLDTRLGQIGLQLITCRRAHRTGRRLGGKRTGRRELINFCFHMEQAHRAGLPILDALRDLRDSTEDDEFRNVLAAVALAIESGNCLSEAMAEFPGTFDEVFISLIRAGERSGELSAVLERMLQTLKWQDELVSHTKKLLMYPAFVGTVVIGVIFFLMLYVVPQMTEFLASMGKEMPFYTIALIATSDFLLANWYWVISLPVVGFIVLRIVIKKNMRVRIAVDTVKLKVWLIGPILEKIIMSRFATYFQIMYASGITILESLHTARGLAGNQVVAGALGRVSQYVADGHSLSAGIERARIFPQLVVRMIKMGEDLGQLDEALSNVTYFYNREVSESVDRLQSMIEPAMTVILGLLLGWVMLSVLSPIYDIISEIGI